MSDTLDIRPIIEMSIEDLDRRITFHHDKQIMEVTFEGLRFATSKGANKFYDRLEERIAETGEELWFFLVNYANTRIDTEAWFAFSRRGKELNEAHSMGSVRFDATEATRRQIERDAGTEAFDPNLFSNREDALARIAEFPSRRRAKIVHEPSYTADEIKARISFDDDAQIMNVDFSNISFEHSLDVNIVYDAIHELIEPTERKWYFLIDYENTRIQSPAWVQFAARGKTLNEGWSLGSVRYAPGSETETDIRLRAETQGFRPNIRNTREEALERIDEMKAEA